ncbi:MAG: hypothetical protein ACYDHM_11225 [Acidiferrobacterales bacterium]
MHFSAVGVIKNLAVKRLDSFIYTVTDTAKESRLPQLTIPPG